MGIEILPERFTGELGLSRGPSLLLQNLCT